MNKRIISLLLLAIMFSSPFAFASSASVIESDEIESEGWIVGKLEELGSWITGLSVGGLGTITGKAFFTKTTDYDDVVSIASLTGQEITINKAVSDANKKFNVVMKDGTTKTIVGLSNYNDVKSRLDRERNANLVVNADPVTELSLTTRGVSSGPAGEVVTGNTEVESVIIDSSETDISKMMGLSSSAIDIIDAMRGASGSPSVLLQSDTEGYKGVNEYRGLSIDVEEIEEAVEGMSDTGVKEFNKLITEDREEVVEIFSGASVEEALEEVEERASYSTQSESEVSEPTIEEKEEIVEEVVAIFVEQKVEEVINEMDSTKLKAFDKLIVNSPEIVVEAFKSKDAGAELDQAIKSNTVSRIIETVEDIDDGEYIDSWQPVINGMDLNQLDVFEEVLNTNPEEVVAKVKDSKSTEEIKKVLEQVVVSNTPSGTEMSTEESESETEEGSSSDDSPPTENQKEEAREKIMSIINKDLAAAPQVVTIDGTDYLVKSGKIKSGEKISVVGLDDGVSSEITLGDDDFRVSDATDLQSAYSSIAVDLDSEETTLANILGSASLAKELAGDKDALKALGLEKVKVDGDVIKATALDGSTVSVKGGKIIDQTAALREGSSKISQMMGLAGGTGLDALVSGATWAAGAFMAGQMVGPMIGLDTRNTNALSAAFAAASGTFRGLSVWDVTAGFTTGANLAIAGAVGIGVFLATYRDEQTDVVEFECMPWQAPSGGDDCELCNDADLPCSEYRCKSLGQNCEIVNSGTEEEKCVEVAHDDVNPPIITPNEAMLTLEYSYDNVKNSPPGPGFEIISENTDGCLKAFSPLAFGISVNEPAQCKIDFSHTTTFDEMKSYMGDNNLYLYNHSEKFSLPSVAILEESSVTLENGKDLTFFIRCKDKSGNENSAEYAVRFCVDPTPDSTAPRVEASSIMNGGCVAEGEESAEVEFYTNEPADCKWSSYDQDYDSMQNEMVRAGTAQINSLQLFSHVANLEGISREDTEFYIRCKDLPDADDSDRNEMRESFKFSLRGSSGLKTRNLRPSETVFGGISPMPIELHVETILGCNNGEAVCSYSSSYDENGEDYIIFFETSTTDGIHNQRLDLSDGEHEYFVRCIDEGGNLVEDVVKFELDINTDGPTIARVYEEAQMLKVVTTRESECSYSLDNCDFSFEEGTMMPYANSIVHLAEWDDSRTFYIKCRDEFRDAGSDCSVIVRPMRKFL